MRYNFDVAVNFLVIGSDIVSALRAACKQRTIQQVLLHARDFVFRNLLKMFAKIKDGPKFTKQYFRG